MKYSTSLRPGGRSFSSPIQRSGHSERSRQSRQYGNSTAGVNGRESGFAFIFLSIQSIHAPSQNFKPVPSHVRMQLCPRRCAHAAVRMQLAATDALELSQRVSRNDAIRGAANPETRCFIVEPEGVAV